jgi:L-aminopeptidase/D-esterase-like protein
MWDGDTVFAVATGQVDAPQRDLEAMATHAVAEAIRRGVRAAGPLGGVPAIGSPVGEAG